MSPRKLALKEMAANLEPKTVECAAKVSWYVEKGLRLKVAILALEDKYPDDLCRYSFKKYLFYKKYFELISKT